MGNQIAYFKDGVEIIFSNASKIVHSFGNVFMDSAAMDENF